MTNANRDMVPEIENFSKAVDQINLMKPDFVIISGDLINADHSPKQIRAFWNIAHKINPDIPLYLVPGNHDIGKANEANINSYRKLFGKDYYSFSHKGSEFIVLNSCLIHDADSDVNMRKEQRKWFESELQAAQKKNPNHIFVCLHHPWFHDNPDEKDDYSNIPTSERKEYLDMMKSSGVEFALAGHLHKESIIKDGSLSMITTSSLGKALGQTPVGFRVFRVYKDHVEHTYYPLDRVLEE